MKLIGTAEPGHPALLVWSLLCLTSSGLAFSQELGRPSSPVPPSPSFLSACPVWDVSLADGAFCPVAIYTIRDGKLVLERTIISPEEGVAAIAQSDDAVFLLHPAVSPTSVKVFFKHEPNVMKEVSLVDGPAAASLSEISDNLNGVDIAVTSDGNGSSTLIMPLTASRIIGVTARPNGKADIQTSLVSLDWTSYRFPLWSLQQAGEVDQGNTASAVVGSDLDILFVRPQMKLAPAPLKEERNGALSKYGLYLEGDYIVAIRDRGTAAFAADASASRVALHVFDRASKRWTSVYVEHGLASLHVAGHWLEAISKAQVANMANGERGTANVADMLLYDLSTGHQRVLPTTTTDAEMIYANGDLIFVRIGLAIYSLDASKAKSTLKLLVEDPTVTTIHWAIPE